jgi:transcription termination/antitermination protein NusG
LNQLMSRENEEDVSGIDDIFDDNKDNINKFPKSDETSKSDSDTIVDQEENELGQDTIQESNGTTEKGVGQEEEGGGGGEGGKSKPSFLGTSTSTTTTTTTTPAATVNSATSEEGGSGGTASATVVAPSPVSDSKFYAIRTTGGQERVVANVLLNKIRSKSIGIYSILLLENFKGYIIVEAPDANVAFQALAGVRHIRGQIRGELPFKDIEGYLIKKPVVTELSIDDTVEVIAGPFKAMKAKITRVDYEKQEATVVLLDSPYQIPVTVDANYLKKALH